MDGQGAGHHLLHLRVHAAVHEHGGHAAHPEQLHHGKDDADDQVEAQGAQGAAMRAQAAEEGRRAEHDARGRAVKGHHPARRRGRHVPGVAGRQAGAVVVGVVVPEVIFKRLVVCLRLGLFLPVTGPEGRDLLAGIFAAAGGPAFPVIPHAGDDGAGGQVAGRRGGFIADGRKLLAAAILGMEAEAAGTLGAGGDHRMRRSAIGRERTAETALRADDVHDATHSREASALQSGERPRGGKGGFRLDRRRESNYFVRT